MKRQFDVSYSLNPQCHTLSLIKRSVIKYLATHLKLALRAIFPGRKKATKIETIEREQRHKKRSMEMQAKHCIIQLNCNNVSLRSDASGILSTRALFNDMHEKHETQIHSSLHRVINALIHLNREKPSRHTNLIRCTDFLCHNEQQQH